MFGTGQPIGVLFLGDDHVSCSQLSSVAYSSWCRVEASWAFPHTFGMSIGAILVQLSFEQP